MTKALYIQIIFTFTAFFGFLLLIYFLFYKREKNIQKYSTMQVIGEVVKHSYLNGSDLAALPVVEYVVEGKIYQKRFSYSTFETTTSKKAKADVFDTKFIRSPYHVLDLKNIFPIGSKWRYGAIPKNLNKASLKGIQVMTESYDYISLFLVLSIYYWLW